MQSIQIFFFILSFIFLIPCIALSEKTLLYEIFYGPVKLGESKLILKSQEYTAFAYTTGPGDILYPYQAKWISSLNSKSQPLKSTIYSKDRFKEREKILYFEEKEKKVLVEKRLPKPKKQVYFLPFPLFDELTAFVFSWHLNFSEKKPQEIPLYIDGERHFAILDLKGYTPCKFGNKTVSCAEILVHLPEKSELLKRTKEVTFLLWIEEKIPVEIRGKLPIFGNLVAKLKSYSFN
ncbi:hypothetical protein THC_0598 [Caldimicrobium thiodismutans]|uniref:DUF3108 domain-containing protein n=1 Tax=Caldimicrobium thiodismutans TaxID=1653476 RepID=A0A0U5B4L8_9BACT|nr:DUF3108 domain-containing protein [Caldimicrobium thiodismutans]BAU22992.1 hypothetical protein THC_0598 [Caldimicrobium thiodismutans]